MQVGGGAEAWGVPFPPARLRRQCFSSRRQSADEGHCHERASGTGAATACAMPRGGSSGRVHAARSRANRAARATGLGRLVDQGAPGQQLLGETRRIALWAQAAGRPRSQPGLGPRLSLDSPSRHADSGGHRRAGRDQRLRPGHHLRPIHHVPDSRLRRADHAEHPVMDAIARTRQSGRGKP